MRKVLLLITLLMLAAPLSGCAGSKGSSGDDPVGGKSASGTAEARSSGLRTVAIAASSGERVKVRVEIADSPAEQQRGLMDRTALGKNRGMIFIFDREQVLSFWMKDTLIPLSIAYLDSNGRIVDIQDMKPLDDDPPHYVSAEPSKYALEVNQGFFDKNGVKVGDRTELPE